MVGTGCRTSGVTIHATFVSNSDSFIHGRESNGLLSTFMDMVAICYDNGPGLDGCYLGFANVAYVVSL